MKSSIYLKQHNTTERGQLLSILHRKYYWSMHQSGVLIFLASLSSSQSLQCLKIEKKQNQTNRSGKYSWARLIFKRVNTLNKRLLSNLSMRYDQIRYDVQKLITRNNKLNLIKPHYFFLMFVINTPYLIMERPKRWHCRIRLIISW